MEPVSGGPAWWHRLKQMLGGGGSSSGEHQIKVYVFIDTLSHSSFFTAAHPTNFTFPSPGVVPGILWWCRVESLLLLSGLDERPWRKLQAAIPEDEHSDERETHWCEKTGQPKNI